MITKSNKKQASEREEKNARERNSNCPQNLVAYRHATADKPGPSYLHSIWVAARMLIIAASLIVFTVQTSFSQGSLVDASGHCLSGSKSVFACWNFEAGGPQSPTSFSEFLPNLRGWDFRINFPEVSFRRLRNGPGSPVSMVGVVEDPTPMDLRPASPGRLEYGHRSNSIWLFRQERGRVLFSQLPSRRDFASNRVENTVGLSNSWFPIGDVNAHTFQSHRIAVAVSGRGLNATTVHVVAVDSAFKLWHNSILVDQTNIASWSSPWQPLNVTARGAASLVSISGNSLGLAWVDSSNNLRAQVFNVATNTWSAPVTVAQGVDPHSPSLTWDGTRVHVIFSKGARLRHSSWPGANAGAFSQPTIVSSLPVVQDQFDAMAFNGGIHVVFGTQIGQPARSAVFYTTTNSRPGSAATWTIPSNTGLKPLGIPRIATLYENIFVVVTSRSGGMRYARKDPNAVDNRITGHALTDRWLDSDLHVDPRTDGGLRDPELLSFNSDLYLTAKLNPDFIDGGALILNLGRSAMKQLLTSKWGMNLVHAGVAVSKKSPNFGGPGEIRLIGDFNGDDRSDLVRFTQKNTPRVGIAPVFVSLATGDIFGNDQFWHPSFSPKEEIPLVGDFNGDGKDDIVNFTQKGERRADGSLVGPSPVAVAVSDGRSFGSATTWHNFFGLKGEIPLVGDFDGDGKQDVVSFAHLQQKNPDGSVLGQAPVFVALSTGTSFTGSRAWHTSFALSGEIPMVGDFNGDGKDDIATFIQKPHRDAAGRLFTASVAVALSDGTHFGERVVWQDFLAGTGDLPRVADLNMDGKADIVTFLHGKGVGLQARNVFTAYSTGSRFETSSLFATDQVRDGGIPYFGNFTNISLSTFTQKPADVSRFLPDLYVFEETGVTRIARAMGQIPFQTGAPWERYKWFTEKGLGAALFPEWIYETGPSHCLRYPFRFVLGGSGGSGGSNVATSPVRIGGRAEHILEEMGHSLFANCLKSSRDPFQLFKLIYDTPLSSGGLDASELPGCSEPFDDCRNPEHFFLQLLKRYRLKGDDFRALINFSPDPAVRSRRRAQYLWLKRHWYRGAEFKKGPSRDATMVSTYGLLCLPGECGLRSIGDPPPTRAECLEQCRLEQNACIESGELEETCVEELAVCRAKCSP